jgi:hypothetical protein
MKGAIFLLLMALLTVIPYGMQHYDVVATYLAPVKPFVFGTPALVQTPTVKTVGDAGTRDYVNTWWGFSLSYPADWVEWPPLKPAHVLSVGPSGQGPYPRLTVSVMPLYLYSLEESPRVLASLLSGKATILHETACCLEDGAPAREAELAWPEDGTQVTALMVATVKGRTLIMAHLSHTSGPTEEEMRRILHSLRTHLSESRQTR